MSDFKMFQWPRAIKGHGMGKKKHPGQAPKPLKKVSKKQRKRTSTLQCKTAAILAKQLELYGTTRCEAGIKKWGGTCFGTLIADHVKGRNIDNADAYTNLQILCSGHNGLKENVPGGSKLDFRPKEMVEAMKELEEKSNG